MALFGTSRCLLGWLALASLAGCSADVAPGEPVELELGIGDQNFEPLVRGQHAPLYAGNQGGYHVWLCFRARGLSTNDVRMRLDLTPELPSMPSHWNLPISMSPVPDRDSEGSMLEFIGWRAQVLQPECAVGSPVKIELTIEDEHGLRASVESEVVPDPPEQGFRRACPTP
ncbi:MAG TPA: hypothetical protein VJV78_42765 [Polyangiales bacterium]|nr:hypothetical protein [Polyangiales bacterium]